MRRGWIVTMGVALLALGCGTLPSGPVLIHPADAFLSVAQAAPGLQTCAACSPKSECEAAAPTLHPSLAAALPTRRATRLRRLQASESEAVTPDSTRVVILDPFAFDTNFAGQTTPAEQALTNEGYHVQAYRRTTLTDRPSVTLTRFVQSSNAGVLIISGHGNVGLVTLEVYASRQTRDRAYDRYLRAGWTKHEILTRTGPLNGDYSYRIAITAQGIRDHWHGKNTFVYLSTCHSTSLASVFLAAGARAVFTYPSTVLSPAARGNFGPFWSRLDGTAYPDADLTQNRTREVTSAFQDCVADGHCADASIAGHPLVLAPAIEDRQPGPSGVIATGGTPFPVTVTFDAPLKQDAPSAVLSVAGCGAQTVQNAAWQRSGRTLQGMYRITSQGELTITVHASAAVSADNGVELDGSGSDQAAVGPNGDDFVWMVPCRASVVHIVFTGTGTIGETSTTTLPDGSVSTDSDTEHVSWTTVWNLDVRTIPAAKSITPGTDNILQSTFDPAASTFTGTGTSGSCSGSFTSNPEVRPPLFVLQPPDSTGTLQIFAPAVAIAAAEPCAHDPIQSIPIGLGGPDKTADVGAFTAMFPLNPNTWQPKTIPVSITPAYTSTSTSSNGLTTVTFTDQWSGTVTLSIPPSS